MQNNQKVNKSEGYIDPGLAASLTEWVDFNNDSFDNQSFDINRIDDEEDTMNLPEASIVLKFELIPDELGLLLDEYIGPDEIVQDSERNINVKTFKKNFIHVFQDNPDEIRSERNFNTSFESDEEENETLVRKVESFVPTIVKLKEGDHRNHILKIKNETRNIIKQKVLDITKFLIKQKLNLMRYLRPLNAHVVNEVLQCMEQIDAKTINIDLDLKGYKCSKKILKQMMTEEIKSSRNLKFGYQDIGHGEEVFFAISTKSHKNFDFEKREQPQDQLQSTNIGKMMKTNRLLRMSHLNEANKASSFINTIQFNTVEEYNALGEFDIVVWLLVQITFNSPDSEVNPGGVRLVVKCISNNEEVYEEIDIKLHKIIKEFETKIITRIILLKLNETREWPEDL